MTSVARPFHEACGYCRGVGVFALTMSASGWLTCAKCDGIGSRWLDGGPLFGGRCGPIGDRHPGEIVRVGPEEQRARIAWHQPRPQAKVKATTTFIRIIDEWDIESDPVPVPSVLGVISILDPKMAGEEERVKGDDIDPIIRAQSHRGDLIA